MQSQDTNFSKSSEAMKWPLRIIKAVVKLPEHVDTIYQNRTNVETINQRIDGLRADLSAFEQRFDDFAEEIKKLSDFTTSFDGRFTNLEAQLRIRAAHARQ